jgi:hypothetical protein
MPMRPEVTPQGIKAADILMAKYGLLRQEMMFYISGVKSHTKYFQIVAGGSLLVLSYVLSLPDGLIKSLGSYGVTNKTLLLVVLLSITNVSFYFVFDLLEHLFTMSHLSARLAIFGEGDK